MKRKFKCEACEKECDVPDYWTEEMAREEWHRHNPGEIFKQEEMCSICDDCYKYGIEIGAIQPKETFH